MSETFLPDKIHGCAQALHNTTRSPHGVHDRRDDDTARIAKHRRRVETSRRPTRSVRANVQSRHRSPRHPVYVAPETHASASASYTHARATAPQRRCTRGSAEVPKIAPTARRRRLTAAGRFGSSHRGRLADMQIGRVACPRRGGRRHARFDLRRHRHKRLLHICGRLGRSLRARGHKRRTHVGLDGEGRESPIS